MIRDINSKKISTKNRKTKSPKDRKNHDFFREKSERQSSKAWKNTKNRLEMRY